MRLAADIQQLILITHIRHHPATHTCTASELIGETDDMNLKQCNMYDMYTNVQGGPKTKPTSFITS